MPQKINLIYSSPTGPFIADDVESFLCPDNITVLEFKTNCIIPYLKKNHAIESIEPRDLHLSKIIGNRAIIDPIQLDKESDNIPITKLFKDDRGVLIPTLGLHIPKLQEDIQPDTQEHSQQRRRRSQI